MPENKSSVVLWSGGLLSTSLVIERLVAGDNVYPIFVDFGQRSAEAQVFAVRKLCSTIGKDLLKYKDGLMPLSFYGIPNVDPSGVGLVLAGLGVSKANLLRLDCNIYIGGVGEGLDSEIFNSILVEHICHCYSSIKFPFHGVSIAGIADRGIFIDRPFAYDAYTWDCYDLIRNQIESYWMTCNKCYQCKRKESILSKFVSM